MHQCWLIFHKELFDTDSPTGRHSQRLTCCNRLLLFNQQNFRMAHTGALKIYITRRATSSKQSSLITVQVRVKFLIVHNDKKAIIIIHIGYSSKCWSTLLLTVVTLDCVVTLGIQWLLYAYCGNFEDKRTITRSFVF